MSDHTPSYAAHIMPFIIMIYKLMELIMIITKAYGEFSVTEAHTRELRTIAILPEEEANTL